MKTRLQRLGNKSLIVNECITPLHDWVRAGDMGARLTILRSLTESGIAGAAPLVKECHKLVVHCLLQYSQGGYKGAAKTKARVFPYGAGAAYRSRVFKQLPSSAFGVTLANVYPLVVCEKTAWPVKLKEHNYPITRLWPYTTLCRYVKFVNAFRQWRYEIFTNYEEQGGKYHSGDKDDDDDDEDDDGESAGAVRDDAHGVSSSEDDDLVFSQN